MLNASTFNPRTPRLSRRLILDLSSSYALSLARVGVTVAIVGVLYRHTTPDYVAMFVLVRTVLTVLTLLFAGVGPATLRALALADATRLRPAAVDAIPAISASTFKPQTLDYATPSREPSIGKPTPMHLWASVLSLAGGMIALIAATSYASHFSTLHHLSANSRLAGAASGFVVAYAIGVLGRVISDPAGAALQHRGRMSLDNLILVIGELLWLVIALRSVQYLYVATFAGVGYGYAVSGACVWLLRIIASPRDAPTLADDERSAWSNLWCRDAVVIAAAFIADLLYGTASVLVINQYLGRDALAAYAPAMQIDSALILAVTAIAAIMLPRASQAAARHDHATLRRMYLSGAFASTAMLAIGALTVLTFRQTILEAWLGTLPPATLSILPLVLVHTVVGGSAGVGRAVLLGMGKFRSYAIASLCGGFLNVALALTLVVGFGWGLRGVVIATIVTVTLRSAIWLPWYVLRSLRKDAREIITPDDSETDPAPHPA